MRYPLIVLEGLDGTGKSTLGKILARRLVAAGMPTSYYPTPPDPFRKIKASVLQRACAKSRYLYFLSSIVFASAELLSRLQREAIVCDRYVYSTLAYHFAFGVPVYSCAIDATLVEPDFLLLLTTTNSEVRSRRVAARPSSSEMDRLVSESGTLSGLISRVYLLFSPCAVETSFESAGELSARIVQQILAVGWPSSSPFKNVSLQDLLKKLEGASQ